MPFVFGWLLNAAYVLLLLAIAPVLVLRRVMHGKYRRGWSEKLTGRLTRRHPEKKCLWFHAVSVGEVLQLQKVLEETQSRFPDAELFLTVTTETGYDVALNKYPQCTVSFFPLDFTWAINRALSSIRPDLIVLVELELWPNLILIARQRRIPLVLINGRMGEKSFRGYRRLKPLMQHLLSCFERLAVQTDTYGDRLKSLGAPVERVILTGNIKFDRVEFDRNHPKTEELRSAFALQKSDTVFIAGSTQDPEESYAINAWLSLRQEFPNLRLIVVPRHKERFDEVAGIIEQHGCDVIRRTDPSSASKQTSGKPVVALLDTLGELASCWGLADIAFVGGSLTNRGGQNMIEPAGYGSAVLFGPNTWNFKDITEALLSKDAARVVRSPDEMRDTIRELLLNPAEAHRLGEAARVFVASQKGATTRTVDLIEQVVRDHDHHSPDSESLTKASGWKRYWPMAKWMLFAIVFVFIARRAVQLFESAPSTSFQIKWPWLLASGAFYFLGWLPSAWFWKVMLNHLGQPIDTWNSLRSYYVGHLGKYIPGKALVLVIRGSMVKEAGFNGMLGGITAAYETLVFMATGTAIFLAVVPFLGTENLAVASAWKLSWLKNQPWLTAGIIAMGTFATTPISAWIFSQIGRKAMSDEPTPIEQRPSISAGLISLGVAVTSLGWCCHALSLGCVLQSLSNQPLRMNQFPEWLSACTLSTVGGFVILIAPGGLGVREGLLIESLKDLQSVGPAHAVVAAGLLRVVWFVTELLAAAAFFVARPHH